MDLEAARFHWVDYLVFVFMLLVSTGVGIFYGLKDKKKASTEEYLMGGRNMNVFPVGFSLFVSWINAITLLAEPVEVYLVGITYIFTAVGMVLCTPIIAHLIAPKYHKMNIVSLFEFLETRFHKSLRLFGSFFNTLITMFICGIALYAPAIAISQVSGLPVMPAIVIIGCVCTFYTVLGGMKAVLWADTIQTFVMFAGLFAAVIQGVIDVGGFGRMFDIAREGLRLDINFTPNPLARTSVWTYAIGAFIKMFYCMSSIQLFVQRFSTVKTPREATIVAYISCPLFVLVIGLLAMLGIVMYGLYADCDPLMSGLIKRRDQMVPLMVLQVLGFLPGAPGLYMACIFSGALSTVSSAETGLATLMLTDFIQPMVKKYRKKPLSDSMATTLAKILGVIVGAFTILMAFYMLTMTGTMFQFVNAVAGSMFSPLAAVFLMGLYCSFVDTLSAWVAFVIGTAVALWLSIGSIYFARPQFLPLSVEGCPVPDVNGTAYNLTSPSMAALAVTSSWSHFTTHALNQTFAEVQEEPSFLMQLYNMQPLMFPVFGFIATMIAGCLAGLIRTKLLGVGGKQTTTIKLEEDDPTNVTDMKCWNKEKEEIIPWLKEAPSEKMYEYKTRADINENVKPLLAESGENNNISNESAKELNVAAKPIGKLSLLAEADQDTDSGDGHPAGNPKDTSQENRKQQGQPDSDEHWRWSWTHTDPRAVGQTHRWTASPESDI